MPMSLRKPPRPAASTTTLGLFGSKIVMTVSPEEILGRERAMDKWLPRGVTATEDPNEIHLDAKAILAFESRKPKAESRKPKAQSPKPESCPQATASLTLTT